MKTIAINLANDITISNKSIAIAKDLQAVTSVCHAALLGIKGEMIYYADAGVPYFELVFGGTPNARQFEAEARRILLNITGVQSIKSFTTDITLNVLKFTVEVVTIYGQFNLKN